MASNESPESSQTPVEYENINPDDPAPVNENSDNQVENNSDNITLTQKEEHLKILKVKIKLLRSQILLFEANKKCIERSADEDTDYLPSSLRRMERKYSMLMLREHLWKKAMHSTIISTMIKKQNGSNEQDTKMKKTYSVFEKLTVLFYMFDDLLKQYSEKMERIYGKKVELVRQLDEYGKVLNEKKFRMEEDEANENPQRKDKFTELMLRVEKINTLKRLQILLLGAGDVDLIKYSDLMKYFENKRQTVTLKNIVSL